MLSCVSHLPNLLLSLFVRGCVATPCTLADRQETRKFLAQRTRLEGGKTKEPWRVVSNEENQVGMSGSKAVPEPHVEHR